MCIGIHVSSSSIQAAEGRAVNAERTCSEFKEDLQKILDWLAGGQSVGFTYIHTLLAIEGDKLQGRPLFYCHSILTM